MIFKRKNCAKCGCKPTVQIIHTKCNLVMCGIGCPKCFDYENYLAPSKELAKANAVYLWNSQQKRKALILNFGGDANEH
jgi:hypothetical protein